MLRSPRPLIATALVAGMACTGALASPAWAGTPPPTPAASGPATTSTTSTSTTTSTTTTTTSTSTTSTTTTTTVAAATTAAPAGTAATTPAALPTCRPATTTTTTTTVPESTTTSTTTTTTLPGTTTTSTTTTTVWLPECPTTTLGSIPEVPPPPPEPEPGQPEPAPRGIPMPKQLSDILLTIRLVESANNYTLPKNRGGASGAYQYIDSTWGNYQGFPSAYLAPPTIQDEKALADVQSILWTWKGDVSMVPVIWYYPKAATDPALMDQVPMPQAGNRLTVRQYQLRWLEMLAQVTGDTYAGLAHLPPELRFLAGNPPELAAPSDVLAQIAYPVLGKSVVAPPVECQAKRCEEGTDAIVFGQKLQPIMAVADGVVTAVGTAGAGQLAVTITDAWGRTYRYTGFNDDTPGTSDGAGHPALATTALVEVGRTVFAGQIIGFLGDTDPMPLSENRGLDPDEPVWPHLRLQIRDADGVRLDTDQLVVDAQTRQACHVGIGPWSSVPDPRLLNPDDDELAAMAQAVAGEGGDPALDPQLAPDGYPRLDPVHVDTITNGSVHVFADGTVQATGNSALILPPLGCQWQPSVAFGSGASGAAAPLRFVVPIDVAARFWVVGTTAAVAQSAPGLLTGVPFGR